MESFFQTIADFGIGKSIGALVLIAIFVFTIVSMNGGKKDKKDGDK